VLSRARLAAQPRAAKRMNTRAPLDQLEETRGQCQPAFLLIVAADEDTKDDEGDAMSRAVARKYTSISIRPPLTCVDLRKHAGKAAA